MREEPERYAIIDEKGILFEGYPLEETMEIFEKRDFEWTGDLLLVKILYRKR